MLSYFHFLKNGHRHVTYKAITMLNSRSIKQNRFDSSCLSENTQITALDVLTLTKLQKQQSGFKAYGYRNLSSLTTGKENQNNNLSFKEKVSSELSHVDAKGKVQMVDVSEKKITTREAIAEAFVILSPAAFKAVVDNKMKKGDVLTVAQIAGILGAKQTSSLIPLCHPLPLSKIDVQLSLQPDILGIRIQTLAKTTSTTGVEMEALTAAAVAALTIYDMCKAVDHNIIIKDIRLIKKTGGKSDFSLI